MATDSGSLHQLPARGVMAPFFMALGMVAAVLNLEIESRMLVWLGLGSLALGLASSHYTGRLLAHAVPGNKA